MRCEACGASRPNTPLGPLRSVTDEMRAPPSVRVVRPPEDGMVPCVARLARYAHPVSDLTDHDAELDAIVAMLEEPDLIEQYTNEDGKEALRLTPKGAQLGRARR